MSNGFYVNKVAKKEIERSLLAPKTKGAAQVKYLKCTLLASVLAPTDSSLNQVVAELQKILKFKDLVPFH